MDYTPYCLPEEIAFPPPLLVMEGVEDEDGLIAITKCLSQERLIDAYQKGIFPWYDENGFVFWFFPPKRNILRTNSFKCSQSLKRKIKKGDYEFRINNDFESVIKHCAGINRRHQEGTWISEIFQESYIELHKNGLAHSFEIYRDGVLKGGGYGVLISKVFSGESMFALESDASKLALYHLSEFCKDKGIEVIDCQTYSEHLESLGAVMIDSEEFYKLLE